MSNDFHEFVAWTLGATVAATSISNVGANELEAIAISMAVFVGLVVTYRVVDAVRELADDVRRQRIARVKESVDEVREIRELQEEIDNGGDRDE